MLEQLRQITSSKQYLQNGGIRIKQILETPWQGTDLTLIIEIFIDIPEQETIQSESWELVCKQTGLTDRKPKYLPPNTQIKLFDEHPALWEYDDSTYFSIHGTCENISELMGDLFIAHSEITGNWIDFHWHYSSLPETLKTQRDSQLTLPNKLLDSCLKILRKHGVEYKINEVQPGEKGYLMLLFGRTHSWPDETNFYQPYIIAKEFEERRVS